MAQNTLQKIDIIYDHWMSFTFSEHTDLVYTHLFSLYQHICFIFEHMNGLRDCCTPMELLKHVVEGDWSKHS